MRTKCTGFIERTVGNLADALEHAVIAETHAENGGLLQGLDPRVKLIGLLALILAAVSSVRVGVTLAILAAAIMLALMSRISLRILTTRVWLGVMLFTGMIALPAIFLTPGTPLVRVPGLHWMVTWQGVHTALRLIARAETAATLAILLVLTTPWTHLLKSLRVFHVPVVMVVILGMTHRYIFLLLDGARDFYEARRCRLVGPMDGVARRRLAAASAGVLLGKSLQISDDVYSAMQARGFRGEVFLLDDFRMKSRDWWALAVFIGLAALAFLADATPATFSHLTGGQRSVVASYPEGIKSFSPGLSRPRDYPGSIIKNAVNPERVASTGLPRTQATPVGLMNRLKSVPRAVAFLPPDGAPRSILV